MNVFASYFWLWTIIALLAGLLLYTVGALLNFVGFLTPFKSVTQGLERASPLARLWLLLLVVGVFAYPSFVHKLWADATATDIRRDFEAIPHFPGAQRTEPTEQLAGLYYPGSATGTYIVDWFGTAAAGADVRQHYRNTLTSQGWSVAPTDGRTDRFVDGPEPARSHYELVLAVSQPGGGSIPKTLEPQPTTYAVRFGAVDPRITTQVSWFVDCLVKAAPTFPTCEALGWHPIEEVLSSPGRSIR